MVAPLSDLPATPINFRVTDVGTSTVTLAWDPAPPGTPEVTQYLVDMLEEPEADYSPVGRVDSKQNNFTAEFLRRGKLYHFRLRAKNDAGYSMPAAELKDTVQVKAPLGT